MKALIILISFWLMMSQSAFGKRIKTNELPVAVKDSFQYTFPDHDKGFLFLGKVNWYTFNNTQYYATFKVNGHWANAIFSDEGHCMETTIKVAQKMIPFNVLESLNTLYPQYDIANVEDVYSETGDRYYRLNISDGNEERLVVMYYSCGIDTENDASNTTEEQLNSGITK